MLDMATDSLKPFPYLALLFIQLLPLLTVLGAGLMGVYHFRKYQSEAQLQGLGEAELSRLSTEVDLLSKEAEQFSDKRLYQDLERLSTSFSFCAFSIEREVPVEDGWTEQLSLKVNFESKPFELPIFLRLVSLFRALTLHQVEVVHQEGACSAAVSAELSLVQPLSTDLSAKFLEGKEEEATSLLKLAWQKRLLRHFLAEVQQSKSEEQEYYLQRLFAEQLIDFSAGSELRWKAEPVLAGD
jgi:hypothetical protein